MGEITVNSSTWSTVGEIAVNSVMGSLNDSIMMTLRINLVLLAKEPRYLMGFSIRTL